MINRQTRINLKLTDFEIWLIERRFFFPNSISNEAEKEMRELLNKIEQKEKL